MFRGIIALLFLPFTSLAQFTYSIDQSIPVEVEERNLAMAWAGGLNSAQINTIDFDGDGQQDVVVFDRAADKLMPYRNAGGRYEYAPDYDVLFPESVSQWMLLRDLNNDGKKDLFTSDPFGIAVFVNTTKAGQPLSWRPYNPGYPLLTKGFSGNINLKVNDVDIPAIDDVDNDGDLDILSMRFVGIGTVEWHKNMIIENTGRRDSLQLERVTQTYGGVQECLCEQYAYSNTPCPNAGGRIQHVGGKTLLTIDMNGDGDRELIFSEESCPALVIFQNQGNPANPLFLTHSRFPQPAPAFFPLFPAPYLEDVDFDGRMDLIVSPNLYARQFNFAIVRNSLWLYKNTGSTQVPSFTFIKQNFLQEDIIDVGDYSIPAFFDVDNDGDEDMFIGFYGNQGFRGGVSYFENIGTPTAASFRLVDEDYGGITLMNLYNVKPQFADMDADGSLDFAFTATSTQEGTTHLFYIRNTSSTGLEVDFEHVLVTEVRIGQPENIRVADINRDGIPDLLVGKATGALQYWENRVNNGLFDQLELKNGTYLGLGNSTSRQNPSVVLSDLDVDGTEDLLMTDQTGNISVFGDFRNFDPSISQPLSEIVYNSISKEYRRGKFGGRLWPAVANLFNSDKPAVVLGNTLGGLFVLRNNEGADLPEEPVYGVGPSPLTLGEDLLIKADRNTRVQILSVLGQKMSEQIFIPANQTYPLALKELAAGMYIARFNFAGQIRAVKFIVK